MARSRFKTMRRLARRGLRAYEALLKFVVPLAVLLLAAAAVGWVLAFGVVVLLVVVFLVLWCVWSLAAELVRRVKDYPKQKSKAQRRKATIKQLKRELAPFRLLARYAAKPDQPLAPEVVAALTEAVRQVTAQQALQAAPAGGSEPAVSQPTEPHGRALERLDQ